MKEEAVRIERGFSAQRLAVTKQFTDCAKLPALNFSFLSYLAGLSLFLP
jgi:hypothetical protein